MARRMNVAQQGGRFRISGKSGFTQPCLTLRDILFNAAPLKKGKPVAGLCGTDIMSGGLAIALGGCDRISRSARAALIGDAHEIEGRADIGVGCDPEMFDRLDEFLIGPGGMQPRQTETQMSLRTAAPGGPLIPDKRLFRIAKILRSRAQHVAIESLGVRILGLRRAFRPIRRPMEAT